MSLTLRATLLIFIISVSVHAENRTLALYSGPARGLDAESSLAMRAELQRLLEPAGLDVVWQAAPERRYGQDFDLVAVASFDGSCSPAEVLPPISTASLADTVITDGRVLPFFHIDCPRLIQMLGSQVAPSVLGRALGRVIAHELYHIVAHTPEHQDSGVAKAVFSISDLKNSRFAFDSWSIDRMRPPAIANSSTVSTEAGGR
ncbi:MAG TPA: hypothetical protein VGK48_21590 [Terriglobia bacterium]|jgi:hypothetical protein